MIEIDSISKLLPLISNIRQKFNIPEDWPENVWYRGQGDYVHELLPSMYRCEVTPFFEREITRDFFIEATQLNVKFPGNPISRLFFAQHHGLPTRLLDWTKNPLVGLFFAVEKETSDDAALYAMAPRSLNLLENGKTINSIPTTNNKIIEKYLIDDQSDLVEREPEAKLPLAFRPFDNSERSTAQSGVFTIHGSEKLPLERFEEVLVEKIRVPSKYKMLIKKELYEIGITYSTLFRSADHLSQSIRYQYGNKK